MSDAPSSGADPTAELVETSRLPWGPLVLGSPLGTLTVMTGPEAGRLLLIDEAPIVIGRSHRSTLFLDNPGVSRSHARVWRDAEQRFHVEDLGSKNGTRIGSLEVSRATLHPGDHIRLGPTAIVRFDLRYAIDAALDQTVYQASVRDPLTHALNREQFDLRLASDVVHCRRKGDLLSLLMIDIDDFKGLNDRFGHQVGDEVLRMVVATIERQLRFEDVLARYGGDEFAVLTRGREARNVAALANRLCREVASHPFVVEGAPLSVTVSIGAASVSELGNHDLVARLVALADKRLYDAKKAGRNRYVLGDA